MKTVDVFTLFMDLSIRSIVRVISSSSFFVFIMQRKEEKKHIFLLILLFYRPAGLYLYTNSYIIRILANRQVVIEKKKKMYPTADVCESFCVCVLEFQEKNSRSSFCLVCLLPVCYTSL
jgi:hypothetical protein